MLQGSSKGLRRAIGLGLLGFVLSFVPGGNVQAVTSMSVSNDPADAMTVTNGGGSGVFASNVLTIDETWGTPVVYGTYSYSRTYPISGGGGSSTYSTTHPGLFDSNSSPFEIQVAYAGVGASPDIVTITKNVINNTGYDWTDFHWAFSYWNGTQWVDFDGASFTSIGGGSMGTNLWDGYSAHWETQNPGEIILGNGGTGTFTISGDLSQISAFTGPNGTLRFKQVPTVRIVPEPSTYLLMGIAGLFGAAMLRRKQAVEA